MYTRGACTYINSEQCSAAPICDGSRVNVVNIDTNLIQNPKTLNTKSDVAQTASAEIIVQTCVYYTPS